MSASVDNRTDLPPARILRAARWTLERVGVNYRLVEVELEHTDHWHHLGRFTVLRIGDFGELVGARIMAKIPRHYNGREYDRGLRGGPPPIAPHSWEEALVCIVAHEGTHLMQWLRGPTTDGYERRGRPVSGRIFSEVEAEWAEYHLLNQWRGRKS